MEKLCSLCPNKTKNRLGMDHKMLKSNIRKSGGRITWGGLLHQGILGVTCRDTESLNILTSSQVTLMMWTHKLQFSQTWTCIESPGNLVKMQSLIHWIWAQDSAFITIFQILWCHYAADIWATLGEARGISEDSYYWQLKASLTNSLPICIFSGRRLTLKKKSLSEYSGMQ